MTWQAIIDQMKEWVLAQGYATEAWVLTKNYATQAWVQAQGYLTTGFVRRITGGGWDWVLGELARDSVWHPLDCSLHVPAGAKAIVFNMQGSNSSIGKTFYLRYPNDVHWNMTPGLVTQVANLIISHCNVIACDGDRKIEFRLTAGGWTTTNLQILGWWL